MITKNNSKKAKDLIEKARVIGLVSHVRMDPDAFGCVLGLQESLLLMGKKVIIFSEEKLIPFIKDIEPKTKYQPMAEYQEVDLVVMCDTAIIDRIAAPKIAENLKEISTVVIDHHASEYEKLDNCIYLTEKRASASELCYEFLKEAGFPLSNRAANYFYVGLNSDTNDLKFQNVTPKTRELAAEIKRLADKDIRDRIETAGKKDREKKEGFYQHCLKNVFNSEKYNAMIAPVTRGDLLKFKMEESVGSQFASYVEENYPGKASFVLMEMLKEDKIKCSLRSNNNKFNVRELAEQYGGGGHDLASGLTLSETLEEAIKKFG